MKITQELKTKGYELDNAFQTDGGRAEVWIHRRKARGVLIEWFRLGVNPQASPPKADEPPPAYGTNKSTNGWTSRPSATPERFTSDAAT